MFKNKYIGIFITLLNIFIISAGLYFYTHRSSISISNRLFTLNHNVLGIINPLASSPMLLPAIPSPTMTPLPTLTPTITPTPTLVEHKISFVFFPTELMEGDLATFTWLIEGPQTTIHTTSVYFSPLTSPGLFTRIIKPAETKYNDMVQEFLSGDYKIPLQFVGNAKISIPGTYFARAYALIGGLHYWSDEKEFKVLKIPRNEIRVLNYPSKIKVNENASFTWEIDGPATVTNYTVIYGGKQSQAGILGENIDMQHTSYTKVLMYDFTNGTYNIPLRFIGNAAFGESGLYYFRAFTWIQGKNIWSEEYSITVE